MAGGRELVHLIDVATGDLTLEGLTLEEALSLPEELGLSPRELNCARPLDSVPLAPRTGVAGCGSKLHQATAGDVQGSTGVLQATASVGIRVRLHRVYHGSVVDGPGRRSVLQVQGCPIRCPGCYVPHTHDAGGGRVMPVEAVVAAVLDRAGEPRDGITVTGGEPFAQPDGLAALLRALRDRGLHTVVYSGHPLGESAWSWWRLIRLDIQERMEPWQTTSTRPKSGTRRS